MIDIDRFFEILTEICNELPDEFFKDLHRGVVLSKNQKLSPYAQNSDLFIMGEYCRSYFGNQITIYYGSFEKLFGYMSEEELKVKLREVVRHEFRHHMENRAGIYGKASLEYEDEINLQRYFKNYERKQSTAQTS